MLTVAPEGSRFRDLWSKDDLTVDIEKPKKLIDVSLVPGVDEFADDLHVLLRHRPRSAWYLHLALADRPKTKMRDPPAFWKTSTAALQPSSGVLFPSPPSSGALLLIIMPLPLRKPALLSTPPPTTFVPGGQRTFS